MEKKKVIYLFSALLLVTAGVSAIAAVRSYNYDVSTGLEWEGWEAFLILVVGTFLVLYELNWFFTVYYFLFKPKTAIITSLNILSNLIFVLIYACGHPLGYFVGFEWLGLTVYVLFAAYAVFLVTYSVKHHGRSKGDLQQTETQRRESS